MFYSRLASTIKTVSLGVCNSSSGCSGSFGVQTSINSYKLYPLSSADVYYGWNGSAQMSDGYFFSKGTTARYMTGAITTTTSPTNYWLRSPGGSSVRGSDVAIPQGSWYFDELVTDPYGFRPAGVLNLDGAQCLLTANISLRKLFRLENADK
jgi:hypothetical protein